jgi:predicted nucleic acid-binding protein
VTRKRLVRQSEASAQAHDWLEMFSTVAPSANAIRAALTSTGAGRASYWDALLIATAAAAGCTAIRTEDMADGSTLHGVRIMNPFVGDALPSAVLTLLSED